MNPSTRIKVGARAALRRRYGYAALRVLRKATIRAVNDHRARSVGDKPYDGETESARIVDGFRAALRRLLKRWPDLDLGDERAKP